MEKELNYSALRETLKAKNLAEYYRLMFEAWEKLDLEVSIDVRELFPGKEKIQKRFMDTLIMLYRAEWITDIRFKDNYEFKKIDVPWKKQQCNNF